ncbi:hypothetical protein D3C87_2015300 [compost metagenome]
MTVPGGAATTAEVPGLTYAMLIAPAGTTHSAAIAVLTKGTSAGSAAPAAIMVTVRL